MKKTDNKNHQSLPIFGIDASRWSDRRVQGKDTATGVEIYCRGVIKSLIDASRGEKIFLQLYTPKLIDGLPVDIQKIIPGRRFWTLWHLSQELRNNPPDFFYTPGYFIPDTAPTNSFATIHDVKYKSFPDKYRLWEKLWQNYTTKKNIKNSKKIVTVSEESKREIIKFYKINPDNIQVIPIGYDRWIFGGSHSYPRNNTILFVGRIEKKKSIDILIKAFAEFSKTHTDWILQLAGKPGFGYEDFVTLAKDLRISDKIKFLGYIDDEKKRELFLRAGIFAHPGHSEGSSIPLFEAWDAETPSIVSDSKVMKEVGGDAVSYFQTGNFEDLAKKINELSNNENLAKKITANGIKKLADMGLQNSGRKMFGLMTGKL